MRPSPSISEFNKIIGAIVKMKDYNTAISLCKRTQLKGFTPCLVFLNILMNCYCHVNRMDFAFSVLGTIFKMGPQPSTITFNTQMKGLCIANQVGEALDFHDDLIAKGLSEISYGTLINGLC